MFSEVSWFVHSFSITVLHSITIVRLIWRILVIFSWYVEHQEFRVYDSLCVLGYRDDTSRKNIGFGRILTIQNP